LNGEDWDAMLLVTLKIPKNKPFLGKRMGKLIKARGDDPIDTLFEVLLEEDGGVGTVYFHHSVQDMQFAIKQPFTSIGSDGSAMSLATGPTLLSLISQRLLTRQIT
jgi:N-acyl-D-amino-acid deacylase